MGTGVLRLEVLLFLQQLTRQANRHLQGIGTIVMVAT